MSVTAPSTELITYAVGVGVGSLVVIGSLVWLIVTVRRRRRRAASA